MIKLLVSHRQSMRPNGPSFVSAVGILQLLLGVSLLGNGWVVLAEENGSHAAQAANESELTGVSFQLDVQPILTKAGCNSGPCHGKQRGQNGFQLSLLGFDSDFDFAAITRESRGRRLFPADPRQSLLLRKAVGNLPHGGGARFSEESEQYRTLLNWIIAGAPRAMPNEPELVGVELARAEFQVAPQQATELEVTARYSDGSTRNVTATTDYLSNDTTVAKVDEAGKIVAGELPGETAIMARYMNHICVASVVIPRSGDVEEQVTALPKKNFVDEHVHRKLIKAGLMPSPSVPDHLFLRRAYTDIIGRLPTVDEARDFLDTESPTKRESLIDELLEKPEFIDFWANQWADALRPNPYRVGIKAVLNYDNWIREQFRANVSYDEFVRRLITAQGSTWRNGAVTLYRDRRTPDEMATLVSQLFLGVRLECAKCHHHPFERWSQRDFYQFAAYFSQVGHKGTGLSPPISGSEESVFVSQKAAEIAHPRTGEKLSPRPLFGEAEIADGQDPREALVRWMTSKDNDYFAQVQVNRVWAHLMGRGLVEPVDDLRSTNPASNPDLLAELVQYFRDNDYDTKSLIKLIVLSNAYSLSSTINETNASDSLNYSRHYRHRFRAEVLLDSIATVTETTLDFDAMFPNSHSSQIWTHRVDNTFLDTFGRPDPNQDPPCERTSDSTVTQALHMMNSAEIDRRLSSDAGRAARLAADTSLEPDAIVSELYLAIYSRYPTDDELRFACDLFTAERPRRQVIEDLMWSMLNTPEFLIQN